MTYVERAGGVGGNELDLHLLTFAHHAAAKGIATVEYLGTICAAASAAAKS